VSLAGKVAIVTGASRGIGKGIAAALASAGAEVIGTATTDAGAQAITESLAGKGRGYSLDVSSQESVDAFFESIKDNHEAPTILVNNAGITRDNLALRMKEDEWDQVIDTNLGSVFRVTKACLRGMTRARWGRVVKAGMEGYSRALASELASRGITVNCIAPGFIGTDMTEALPDDQKAALLSRIPAGRLGDVSEIAALVVFLAGDSAGYITGETIHINGGMYMS
jgi:3-oxoacyl-[acyl-carrier protein] reductase